MTYPVITLSSMTGNTPDDRLATFNSYATAQTYKPTLQIDEPNPTFTQPFKAYNGLSITGHPRNGDEFGYNQKVNINIPGSGWIDVGSSGTVKGIYIGNLSFVGNKDTSWFVDHDNTAAVLWASNLHNLGFNLFKHVIWGAQTAVTFSGFWDVNNGYDTQFKLWGSDSNFWPEGMLLDSPNIPTGPLLWFANYSKSNCGPVFVTGRNANTPVQYDGGGSFIFDKGRFESPQGIPNYGSQMIINGGHGLTVRNAHFFNGMSNPGTSKGILQINNGTGILIDSPTFSDGWGQQSSLTKSSAPHIYVNGGSGIKIRNILSQAIPRVVRSSNVLATSVDSDVSSVVG